MSRVTEDYQLRQFTAHPRDKLRGTVSEEATHEEQVNRSCVRVPLGCRVCLAVMDLYACRG